MNSLSIGEVFERSFAEANRRIHLVLSDLLWKCLWASAVGVVFAGGLLWLGSDVAAFPVDDSRSALSSPVGAAALARQVWRAYGREALWGAGLFAFFAVSLWILLEGFFRAGILSGEADGFRRRAASHFGTFLATGVAKTLAVSGSIAIWAVFWSKSSPTEVRSVIVIGAALLAAIWFTAMALESVLRSDALDLLCSHPWRTLGALAVLALFEAMIAASAVVCAYVFFAIATGLGGLVMALAGTALLIMGLNGLHAYLLIVRFSALGIMSHAGEF